MLWPSTRNRPEGLIHVSLSVFSRETSTETSTQLVPKRVGFPVASGMALTAMAVDVDNVAWRHQAGVDLFDLNRWTRGSDLKRAPTQNSQDSKSGKQELVRCVCVCVGGWVCLCVFLRVLLLGGLKREQRRTPNLRSPILRQTHVTVQPSSCILSSASCDFSQDQQAGLLLSLQQEDILALMA